MHTKGIRSDRDVRMQIIWRHPEVMEEIEKKVRAHYHLDQSRDEKQKLRHRQRIQEEDRNNKC